MDNNRVSDAYDKFMFLVAMTVVALTTIVVMRSTYERKEQRYLRQQYIRDSIEIDYYKRHLDRTFEFDHSKIPDDGSNT